MMKAVCNCGLFSVTNCISFQSKSPKPDKLYYSYSDFQGSLLALTDDNGNVVERYAYDPWGARRNPADWTQIDSRTTWMVNRGYTGHEHLDAFGIINMNGRVYDPATAQFFSPDPFVQSPDNWQNYNRYAYCLNNPVMYTDPSGYQYIQQEEDNKFKWSFQDEIARTERELGLGTDGITSFNDTWNGYISAKSKGWLGSYSDFQQIADKQTRNSNYNGIVVVHTFFNSKMINEVGVTSKIATTIIVKLGKCGLNETDLTNRVGTSIGDVYSGIDNISNIGGTTAGVLKSTRILGSIGVWKNLSKIKIYRNGWTGNKTVKSFGTASMIGYGMYGLSIYANFKLATTIDQKTGLPYQSVGQTGFNIGMSTLMLKMPLPVSVGYGVGSEVFQIQQNAFEKLINNGNEDNPGLYNVTW